LKHRILKIVNLVVSKESLMFCFPFFQQYRQAVSKTPSMRHQRSFSAFGFGASSGSTVGSQSSQSSRRGSQINVNVTPAQTQEASSDTPEIRKYKKRFNSDILCASLWGKN